VWLCGTWWLGTAHHAQRNPTTLPLAACHHADCVTGRKLQLWVTNVNVRPLAIPGVMLIEPTAFWDERGFFSETFNERVLAAGGLQLRFVQDNHSLSVRPGVVRGLHFQIPPHAQDKLVRVTRGAIFDVAVDLRVGSPTYGRHVSATISADNWLQILVPKGFAHGFCTLEPNTEVLYKVTDYYTPDTERGVRWDDPALGIEWPVSTSEAILSPKDATLPPLSSLPPYFSLGG
jgi:dTDP-4-dehydrorhamnose 3,5-epimerase